MPSAEPDAIDAIGELNDAVLAADFGLISIASLVIGVACADTDRRTILLAAVAVMCSGAFAIAAENYLSVASEADRERAELARRRQRLAEDPGAAQAALAGHYVGRGLAPGLAAQVASGLLRHDPAGEHTRDELGLAASEPARPLRAAVRAGVRFVLGATVPMLLVLWAPPAYLVPCTVASTLALLALLATLVARADGASEMRAVVRATFWGALVMGAAALEGVIFGAAT